jgi:hypothetical protein
MDGLAQMDSEYRSITPKKPHALAADLSWSMSMDCSQPVCDIDVLIHMEQIYTSRLQKDPADMDSRLSLAWCLFMQALHQAGRESIPVPRTTEGLEAELELGDHILSHLERESSALLQDCLTQTFTVMQLSSKACNQQDVAKLQELVRLTGAREAVLKAEDEALRFLANLTRDILIEPDIVDD